MDETLPSNDPPARPWWWLGLPLGLALAWEGWRMRDAVGRARELAQQARVFESRPEEVRARVLLIGDSTGVGVGASRPEESLAGWLAHAHPHAEVVNRCENGARVADAVRQIAPLAAAKERYDLLLILVGGNDALRHTPADALGSDARTLLDAALGMARCTVWMGSANIGSAPLLRPPLAWWMGWRTRRTMQLLAGEARAHGVPFIDFVHPRRHDLFGRRPETYFAEDGVHPSAASYRHAYQVLARRLPLAALLGPARRHRSAASAPLNPDLPPRSTAMPTVSEIMSTDVQVIEPQETLRKAAQLMQRLDVGALPVCNGRRLLGMLTDRDIAVRGVAEGHGPEDACVSDVMTQGVPFATTDQDAQDVMRLMGEQQVRRLPVVDADRNLVGIVSLGDLATRQDAHVDQTVREVSAPAGGAGIQAA